jgi:hypothetical protein
VLSRLSRTAMDRPTGLRCTGRIGLVALGDCFGAVASPLAANSSDAPRSWAFKLRRPSLAARPVILPPLRSLSRIGVRERMERALRAVSGVTSAVEHDNETWFVTVKRQ